MLEMEPRYGRLHELSLMPLNMVNILNGCC